ncbi:MAG: 16S rRNA pseudouridine(516) synthase [Lachnospiraceae bacterium]|nr:16S rRNA pseudouridine(516) synthase [Lachnospiraceae bacterium]
MVHAMRLDKYVASCAGLSRKEARTAIRQGRVTMEGEPVFREEVKAGEQAEVCLDGVVLQAEQYIYYMLNKPAGVVSATKDARECTVLDLLPPSRRALFPVGRLDKDAEGLLLVTDDGELAHRLLSPKYHVEKTYEVNYIGELIPEAEELFTEGMDIGEKHRTKPARLVRQGEGQARISLAEGKYHQVKRMVAKAGGHVTYLRRIAMAGLMLDETLSAGEYRRLTEEEIEGLREAARGC